MTDLDKQSDADPEKACCWICLGSEDPLVLPCACRTRPVHASCLARWQLQAAGKTEENHCRFCNKELPDWRASLTPPQIKPVTPVMAIKFEGKTFKLRVQPGPEGLRQFKEQVRSLLGLEIDDTFDVSFECQVPTTGEKLKLTGLSSYGAATHCAAITAAEREVGRPHREKRHGGVRPYSSIGPVEPRVSSRQREGRDAVPSRDAPTLHAPSPQPHAAWVGSDRLLQPLPHHHYPRLQRNTSTEQPLRFSADNAIVSGPTQLSPQSPTQLPEPFRQGGLASPGAPANLPATPTLVPHPPPSSSSSLGRARRPMRSLSSHNLSNSGNSAESPVPELCPTAEPAAVAVAHTTGRGARAYARGPFRGGAQTCPPLLGTSSNVACVGSAGDAMQQPASGSVALSASLPALPVSSGSHPVIHAQPPQPQVTQSDMVREGAPHPAFPAAPPPLKLPLLAKATQFMRRSVGRIFSANPDD